MKLEELQTIISKKISDLRTKINQLEIDKIMSKYNGSEREKISHRGEVVKIRYFFQKMHSQNYHIDFFHNFQKILIFYIIGHPS